MEKEKKYTLDELKKKLTNKERIFCHQYIIDWNGSRSARHAGYSKNSARQIADENLSKPHIKQYIGFIKDDIEKESGITKLKQLNELNKIAYSTIAHLHESWIKLKEFESLTDEQRSCIESIETKSETKKTTNDTETETIYVKIKLYSKIQAIDQINKMMGYNAPEKNETTLGVDDQLKRYLTPFKSKKPS